VCVCVYYAWLIFAYGHIIQGKLLVAVMLNIFLVIQ
jgi:hypothetical protein